MTKLSFVLFLATLLPFTSNAQSTDEIISGYTPHGSVNVDLEPLPNFGISGTATFSYYFLIKNEGGSTSKVYFRLEELTPTSVTNQGKSVTPDDISACLGKAFMDEEMLFLLKPELTFLGKSVPSNEFRFNRNGSYPLGKAGISGAIGVSDAYEIKGSNVVTGDLKLVSLDVKTGVGQRATYPMQACF